MNVVAQLSNHPKENPLNLKYNPKRRFDGSRYPDKSKILHIDTCLNLRGVETFAVLPRLATKYGWRNKRFNTALSWILTWGWFKCNSLVFNLIILLVVKGKELNLEKPEYKWLKHDFGRMTLFNSNTIT